MVKQRAWRRSSHEQLKIGVLTLWVFIGLVLLDVVVVEGYYRPLNVWDTIWIYHLPYFWVGMVLIPILLAWNFRSLLPLTIIIASEFGIEDTLYYLIQFRLPRVYGGISMVSGLFREPTLIEGLMINTIGASMICLLVVSSQIVRSGGTFKT